MIVSYSLTSFINVSSVKIVIIADAYCSLIRMDSRHTSKKIRLSSGNAKNYTNYRDPPTNTDPLDDDFGLWGEELEVDDDVMQQIETQGYSQYQMIQVIGLFLTSNFKLRVPYH